MAGRKHVGIALAMLGLMVLSCAVSAQDSSFVQAMETYKARNYQDALPQFDAALAKELQSEPFNDSLIAEIHYRRGVVLGRLSDLSGSVKAYKESLRIHLGRTPRDSNRIVGLYNNLGNKYMALADYPGALANHQKALSLRLILNGPNSDRVAASYNMIGAIYWLDDDFDQSIVYYEKALRIRMADPNTPRENIAFVLVNIGSIHLSNRNFEAALESYSKGEAFLDSSDQEQWEYLVLVWRGMGLTHLELRNLDKAEKFFAKALKRSSVAFGSSHRETAKLHLDLAEIAAQKGEEDDALQGVQRALKAFLPHFNPQDIYENPGKEKMNFEPWLYEALYDKANYFRQRYETPNANLLDLHAAMECFELAIWQVEHIKHSFSAENAKEFIALESYSIYEDAIAVALMLAELEGEVDFHEKAFEIAEKSRAVLLLESLIKLESLSELGVPDSISERGMALDLAIASLRIRDDSLSGDSLYDLVLEKEAFMQDFQQDYPAFFDLKYGDELVHSKELRNTFLESHDVLFEYVLGRKHVFVFALTQKGIQVRQFVRDSVFDRQLKTYQKSLSQPPSQSENPKNAYQEFVKSAHYLYQMLLEHEVGPMMTSADKKGHLMIIPDGELWRIPFEALLTTQAGKGLNYNTLPYLIKDFELSYGWSATLLAKDSQQKEPEVVRWLGYAPDSGAFSRAGLSPLPGALESSRKIAQMFKGQLRQREQASEDHFKTHSSGFNVLHLATHGTLDDSHPNSSKIFLYPSSDSLEDGQLHTYELFGLHLDAELVVLSACNTGNGKVIRGEGIASLARGFAQAGCPNVVMSLWNAQAQSTSQIMEGFYEGLGAGQSSSAALRESKLSYLSEVSALEAHPYYWSVFESIGRSAQFEPLKTDDWTYRVKWILGVTVAVLVLLWAVWKFFSRIPVTSDKAG